MMAGECQLTIENVLPAINMEGSKIIRYLYESWTAAGLTSCNLLARRTA